MSRFFEPLPQPCAENNFVSDYIEFVVKQFHGHGHSLLDAECNQEDWARTIWEAPFAVLSHNAKEPPLFAYANQCGLDLFELQWSELITLPSSTSAEPQERAERAKLLAEVREKGIINHYSGVRISSSGKRFRIDDATVCNLWDGEAYVGQAVVFKEWEFLG